MLSLLLLLLLKVFMGGRLAPHLINRKRRRRNYLSRQDRVAAALDKRIANANTIWAVTRWWVESSSDEKMMWRRRRKISSDSSLKFHHWKKMRLDLRRCICCSSCNRTFNEGQKALSWFWSEQHNQYSKTWLEHTSSIHPSILPPFHPPLFPHPPPSIQNSKSS